MAREKRDRIGPVDFTEIVADADHGRLNARLTAALNDVVTAVGELGSGGKVTLEVSVKRDRDMAKISFKMSSKKPHEPTRDQLYYFGQAGGLVEEDPRQVKIPFGKPRAVDPTDPGDAS